MKTLLMISRTGLRYPVCETIRVFADGSKVGSAALNAVSVCVCDCIFGVCVCRRVSSSSCPLISSSVFSAELFHERAERMFSWIYCYYTSLSPPLPPLSDSPLHSCPLSLLSTLSSLSLSLSQSLQPTENTPGVGTRCSLFLRADWLHSYT